MVSELCFLLWILTDLEFLPWLLGFQLSLMFSMEMIFLIGAVGCNLTLWLRIMIFGEKSHPYVIPEQINTAAL